MPSTFFGLTIASSGLSAYQASLNTTANNVSNVRTEGYTRQVANLQASEALRVSAKYGTQGSGVTVTSIKQVRSEYYDVKYWENQASLGLFETKLNYLQQIENYYIDDDTAKGFSTILNDMFNALDTMKNNAGDVNVRQQFISNAQNFTTYFNSVAIGLGQVQDTVNEEIKSTVENINSIGEKIAILNNQINTLEIQGGYANELRDQRALLIDELSSIVPVEVSEVPVSNSNFPDMLTGANYYTVKINGQLFVDTEQYNTLVCVAREDKINQSDMEGMYDIYWEETGSKFNAGSEVALGSLKGLFDIRDGNNAENFTGKITNVTNSTITISEALSITSIETMTMPQEGVLTIAGKDYSYKNFTYTTDAEGNIASYTFELDEALSSEQMTAVSGRKASIGASIDSMGIPYYMAQMNEFLRSFALSFNEIVNDGQDLNGVKADYYSFFTGTDAYTKEEILFQTISGDTTYSIDSKDKDTAFYSYYFLTCQNVCVSDICVDEPSAFATTVNIADGVDKYELVEQMALLKSDTPLYRGGGADDFLKCMISDISVDTQESQIFYKNYANIAEAVSKQRTSVSGVDEDEEALNLVKFQNAYNLSSKMVSVLTEVYDRLILETGV